MEKQEPINSSKTNVKLKIQILIIMSTLLYFLLTFFLPLTNEILFSQKVQLYFLSIIIFPLSLLLIYVFSPNVLIYNVDFNEMREKNHYSSISIIIPAYNEDKNIEQTVISTYQILSNISIDKFEIIVIDDGSSDSTMQVLENLKRNRYSELLLLSHEKNKGYGAALKTGFSSAKGDLIVFYDADGTYPIEKLPKLINVLENSNLDILVGSRLNSTETSKMPLVRRLGNVFFALYTSLLIGVRISDTASGMRVFKRSILVEVNNLSDGLYFTPEMTVKTASDGRYRYGEFPIPYHERIGESKLNPLLDGLQFLKVITCSSIMRKPMRFITLGTTFILWSYLFSSIIFLFI